MINNIREKYKSIPLAVRVSTAYAICSILQQSLSFITLPLFARLLTTEQYGQYTIYASWVGILSIFLTLNLAYGSFQTAMVKFEERRIEYISSIQGIFLILATLFLIIYFLFRDFWNRLFELPTGIVLLMISEIIFSACIQLWMGKNRFEFKYKSVIAVTLITSIIAPVIAYLLVNISSEKGYARIIGYASVNIIVGFCIFLTNIKKCKKIYNKEFWSYAFSFNIPLLAYYLSQVIFNQSDRIMISHMTGTSNAAMYGVAYSLAMILSFVLNAINASYVPWMYGTIKENKSEENRPISAILSILLALMILCVIWYAPEIILLMAGEQYLSATYVVAPVSMSLLLLFYCQLFINVEFYYEEKKKLVYASIGAAITNIVLNYLLIPIFGFVVAGYTTLLSYIIFALSNYFTLGMILKKNGLQNDIYNYKMLLLIFIVFLASGLLGVELYNFLPARIAITLIVLLIFLFYRNKFIDVLKKIKEP